MILPGSSRFGQLKGTVMQIEKALINDHDVLQKYPEDVASQLLIIL